jgi:antibiotic biosynthesis monooxygenase (ABM) superfamily enzyme
MQLFKQPRNKNWKETLHKYFSVPAEEVFPRFKLGVVIFFWGLVLMYSANQLLEPSLSQEIVTLIGLLLIGGGFLYAMAAQVRMLIGRFVKEFSKKNDL